MREDLEELFDPSQPTLIVTYGNTTRRYRPLNRSVIVLGRAPNCDLNLVGEEVAPIHCLLVRRLGGGWRVRNFGGRIGTQVNGQSIQDEIVDHDDTLQIGSFSFKFHLPPPFRRPGLKVDVPPDSAEASHLRRSRRNLVRLALNLRRRLLETTADLARAEEQLQQQEQDVHTLRESARSRQQALESLRAKREAEERDLLIRCQSLDRQEAALNRRLQTEEADLARLRFEADAAIQAAWVQCRERCRAAEEAVSRRERQAFDPAEEALRLERRGVELAHYACHLRRVAERAAAQEASLVHQKRELTREYDRLNREEVRRRIDENPSPATPALRERLAKVQKLKKGLEMLRTSDSAPGVSSTRTPTRPLQTADIESPSEITPE